MRCPALFLRFKANVTITDLPVCGTTQNLSVAGNLVWIIYPNGHLIETGYYEGYYEHYGLQSPTDPHYFWGRRYATGPPDYSDISDGLEIYPNLDEVITFSVMGNADSGDLDWHVRIEKPGSYTININDLTATYSSGSLSEVVMEVHNGQSQDVSANFTEIRTAYESGGSLSWVEWNYNSSPETYPSGGIYQSNFINWSAYCMDTSYNEVCD